MMVSCCSFSPLDIWRRIESAKRRPTDFLPLLPLGLAFSSPVVDLLGESLDLTEPNQEARLAGVLGDAESMLCATLCLDVSF
jgi:hypothetical protein